MGSMNRVFLMGNLTRDPQLRKTPSGASVVDLGLAISQKRHDKEGETKEEVCFVDVVVWGRQAEHCAQYLAKGSGVMVEGGLRLEQWKTEGGENRSRLRVWAQNVQFLGAHRSEKAGQAPAAAERPKAAAA